MYMMPLFLVLAFAAWASAFPSANGMVPQDVVLRESALMGSHDDNPDATLPWKAPTITVRKHTHESKTHRQWLIGIQGQMSDKLKAREQPEACKACEGALKTALQNADANQEEQEQSEDVFESQVAANNDLAETIDALNQEKDELRDRGTTLSQEIVDLTQQLAEKETELAANERNLTGKQSLLDVQRAHKTASESALNTTRTSLEQMRATHKDQRDADALHVTETCGALKEGELPENVQDQVRRIKQKAETFREHKAFRCSPAASSPRSVRGTDANKGFAWVGCGDCDAHYDEKTAAQSLEDCADECAQVPSCKRFSYGQQLGCRISNDGICPNSVDRSCAADRTTECCDSAERCGASNRYGGHMYQLVHGRCTDDDDCQPGLVCVGARPLPNGPLLPPKPTDPGLCETPPSCADAGTAKLTLADGTYNPACCGLSGRTHCDHCNGSCQNGEGDPDREQDNPRCCMRGEALSSMGQHPSWFSRPEDPSGAAYSFASVRS